MPPSASLYLKTLRTPREPLLHPPPPSPARITVTHIALLYYNFLDVINQ